MSDEKHQHHLYYTHQLTLNSVEIEMFMKIAIKENTKMNKLVVKALLPFVFFFVVNQDLKAEVPSDSAPSLKQVIAAAMTISNDTNNLSRSDNVKNSSWLASSPKLGMSYLKSDLQQGTDETEISINLPMKSFRQRSIENKLYGSSQKTQLLLKENKRLVLSGIIREQLWKIKLAEHKISVLKQKFIFLSDLENQYQLLFQSSALNHYPLLLIKKEMLDCQMEQLELEQTTARIHQQYSTLTGFTRLPVTIIEQFFDEKIEIGQLLTNHPEVKKLDQDWFEQMQQLKLSSKESESWNLSFIAKKFTNLNLNETQLGVAAEIPLTIFNSKSQSSSSEWAKAKGNYYFNRDNLLISLRNDYLSLMSEQKILNTKHELLLQAKSLSEQIISETQLLIEANQIDQDIAFRRMLTAFNTKTQLTTNKLLLLKNSTSLNQAAGISL